MKYNNFELVKSRIDFRKHLEKHEDLHVNSAGLRGYHNHEDSKAKDCFQYYEETDSYFCFHCKEGGDLITYEMNRLNLPTEWDALKSLASDYNITLHTHKEDVKSDEFIKNQERGRLVSEILKEACIYYHSKLQDVHIEWLTSRGFTDATISKNLIGYALKSKDSLYKHIKSRFPDVEDELLLSTGLFAYVDGKFTDHFKGRVIFPTFSTSKKDVCYMTGRDFIGNQNAKYKHLRLRDTDDVVRKSMWNMHSISDTSKPIIICEGTIDALLVDQEFGDRYAVVSPFGSQLSKDNIEFLSSVVQEKSSEYETFNFIILNDTDRSGMSGAVKSGKLLSKQCEEKLRIKHGYSKDASIADRKAAIKSAKKEMPLVELTILRKPPYIDKIDAADFIVSGKKDELEYWIEASVSLSYIEKYKDRDPIRFFDNPKGYNFRPKYLVDEILFEGRFFQCAADTLYQYKSDGSGGFYTDKDTESTVRKIVNRKLGKQKGIQRATEIVNLLKVGLYFEPIIDTNNITDPNEINFRNGILNSSTMDFRSSTVDDLFLYQLPVCYKKDAKCDNFDRFVSEVLPG